MPPRRLLIEHHLLSPHSEYHNRLAAKSHRRSDRKAPSPNSGRGRGGGFPGGVVYAIGHGGRVSPPFRRVLVANRGEIAVRVLRACQELGIHAIAVYSEADRGALHTRLADEAHPIGSPPARESYLNQTRILEVARLTGAEAIHPGYGFLSENADFAAACAAAKVTFVGPPPAAMRLMGDKAAARRLVARHDVPVVPGYDGDEQDDETLLARAREIGFPLLIKAAAGGGGRGMRVVIHPEAFSEALEGARREARAAFGDGAMILERYIAPARHVEVQVLGDHHGALVHLGERECSVQRRHQKVIEESPSPAVGPELRAALGATAVRAARAAGYANAGTCEFLLDAKGRFYFIEMNARLQVEHPVTELVTGLDLVRRQLEIAAGRPLGLRQEEVALRGHAIECRVYAEDPSRDFLPAAGRLERFAPPLGHGLRHDVGFAEGDIVNTYYDAMLAKLIAFGEDRATALARARWAIERYIVAGPQTNLSLLRWVLDHPRFAAGETTTDFLAHEWRPSVEAAPPLEALAAAAAFELATRVAEPLGDPWRTLRPWRLLDEGIVLTYRVDGAPRTVIGRRDDRPDNPAGSAWSMSVGDQTRDVVVESDGMAIVGAVRE
ncbi:MAG: acetyl-CoA carboxylase biotin carboxylase subunit, partial [Chloroflexi bacterium]|nr:acetyl-CoA carboxylase biotin carboxylase subunit [Chloroflexota bacterium]